MKIKCSKIYLLNKYGSVDKIECNVFFVHNLKVGYKVSLFAKNFKRWQNFKVYSYIVGEFTSEGPFYYLTELME